MKKLGVFVCHCGINISSMVDVEDVAEYARGLDGVEVSTDYKYMCSDVGATLIKDSIKEHGLGGVVVACCSPRMHEHTFRKVTKDGGVNAYNLEIANIREQCSWAHSDKVRATEKAKALVRAAAIKALMDESLESSRTKVTPVALVVGGGIAGIQAALDLADTGYKVHLVEKEPSIGGKMSQLDKTFPTLDCSSCILTPKMMEVYNHPRIDLLTYSEIDSVEGSIGNYKVKVRKKPRYIDTDKCTGCTDCVSACRMKDRVDNEFNFNMNKRSAVYMTFPQAIPLKTTIDPDSCLYLRFGKCGDGPLCVEACEVGAIDFDQKEEILELNVGSIIVATGYDLVDGAALYEYGYDNYKDVITTLELERLISSSGPTAGKVLCPSNGEAPKSVTFILCVGSRDETECSWCCRIGCMSALKHVYLLKEKLGKGAEINICYTDIRSFGKGYEEFYGRIRKEANFFRGRPSEVRGKDDGLKMDVFDTTTGKLLEISTDMVVLVPALVPRSDSDTIARALNISRSGDGFFLEAHPKLRPMDTFTNGIFIAGCCQAPKDIQDTVAQASGAAARASVILSKDELENDPLVAAVDPDICAGCGICVEVCPYKARTMNDWTKIAEVDEALCEGCGACVIACPSNASIHRNFTKQQIMQMVDNIL